MVNIHEALQKAKRDQQALREGHREIYRDAAKQTPAAESTIGESEQTVLVSAPQPEETPVEALIVPFPDIPCPGAKHYERIATNLLAQVSSRPACLLVTSAARGEGKTTLSMGLARVLAKSGRGNVLLVDGDFERAGLSRRLRMEERAGLLNILTDKETNLECIDFPGSSNNNPAVLPSGFFENSRGASIDSSRLASLFARMKKHYRWIIVDGLEVNSYAGEGAFTSVVDYGLVVVRSGKTGERVARAAVSKLRSSGIAVAGCVVNGVAGG